MTPCFSKTTNFKLLAVVLCLPVGLQYCGISLLMIFQTQKGGRRFKRIENRNGVFALLVSFKGHKDFNVVYQHVQVFQSILLRCFKCHVTLFSQTNEERQQALQAFAAQSFLASGSGPGTSAHAFPSPSSSSEPKPKAKRGPRKNQREKYRLKYLRLRKTARAMIFVSLFSFFVLLYLKLFFLATLAHMR